MTVQDYIQRAEANIQRSRATEAGAASGFNWAVDAIKAAASAAALDHVALGGVTEAVLSVADTAEAELQKHVAAQLEAREKL